MITEVEVQDGQLYLCRLAEVPDRPYLSGKVRVVRYGYHRKNNDQNWSNPPGYGNRNAPMPTMIWYGWRDHETLVFLRPQHIEEVIDIV